MGRWLAPLLAGPQHWVLHDRDADLLALAAADAPGRPLTARPSPSRRAHGPRPDGGARPAGARLITASALLDLLTAEEMDRLAGLCAEAGCPILLTLSVVGSVEISPADPLDRRIVAAFDAHQRRATKRGPLLGPDAVDVAAQAFRRLGAEVLVRPSPWRLGPSHSALAAEWFIGWVGAACEQDAELAERVRALCPPTPRTGERRGPRGHRGSRRPARAPWRG